MYIHNYQIHNVLNVYQRQLTQGLSDDKQKPAAKSQENSQLHYKRDRQTILEKVASNVLESIDLLEKGTQSSEKFEGSMQRAIQKENLQQNNSKEFSFNVIDQNNKKVAGTISVDNPRGLIYYPDKSIQNEKQSSQPIDSKIEVQEKGSDQDKPIDIKV